MIRMGVSFSKQSVVGSCSDCVTAGLLAKSLAVETLGYGADIWKLLMSYKRQMETFEETRICLTILMLFRP